MMRIWPGGNLSPLAKKELKWMGPFGAITYLCGITFIDRLNPERSRKTIDDLAVKINRENVLP
jgi:1-acyl-sn-glycerol-3-phosphate acyltransferase